MGTAAAVEQKQYLTFTLDSESYALEVAKVREILDLVPITKVPRMPEFMRGVINLRGSVVPVMDLRAGFGMPTAEDTVDTCIVIVEVSVDGDTMVLGALADSVQEVIELDSSRIEPLPKMGARLHTDFIKGMGKHDEAFLTILDIDKVFSQEDLARRPEAGDA